jgi:hypothetical protein
LDNRESRLALFGIDSKSKAMGESLQINKSEHRDNVELLNLKFCPLEDLTGILSVYCRMLQLSFDGSPVDSVTTDSTGWVAQLSRLISSAVKVAEKVHLEDAHVLVNGESGR